MWLKTKRSNTIRTWVWSAYAQIHTLLSITGNNYYKHIAIRYSDTACKFLLPIISFRDTLRRMHTCYLLLFIPTYLTPFPGIIWMFYLVLSKKGIDILGFLVITFQWQYYINFFYRKPHRLPFTVYCKLAKAYLSHKLFQLSLKRWCSALNLVRSVTWYHRHVGLSVENPSLFEGLLILDRRCLIK